MSGRKKVLFISGALSLGGAERLCSTLCCELNKDLVEISLCVIVNNISYSLPPGVKLYSVDHTSGFTIYRTIRRISELIDAVKPDCIVSFISHANRFTSAALKLSDQNPAWIARIGLNPEFGSRTAFRQKLVNIVERRTYVNAERVIVNSVGLQHAVINHFEYLKDRVKTIFNPTDFTKIDTLSEAVNEKNSLDNDKLHIVYPARLHPQKRHDVLFEACKRIDNQVPCVVHLAGEGYLESVLKKQCVEGGIEKIVKFHGFLNNPYPLIRACDIVCMTSAYEGMPNALIESQGLGLPAVSSRCPFGPEEIIRDGETGILTPVGDSNETFKALLHYASSSSIRKKDGSVARSHVREKFDLMKNLAEWERLILDYCS